MKEKFIYCYDENLAKTLYYLDLVLETNIKGKPCWIFENDGQIRFNNQDLNKIEFSNKFFI